MARMPSTLGERVIPRPTRRIAAVDNSAGLGLVRRGTNAVGGGLDDLSKGLQSVSDALYEEGLKDEERQVKNLENEWSKKRREILFGDGTPTNQGFYSTAGEDTINSRKGVEDKLNKARSQILGKASGVRVKQAFDLSSNASLQGELEQVDRYTIGQRKEANSMTAKASIAEAKQQASTYFSDPAKWEAAVERIATEAASLGDNEGWSQEAINTFTQQQISDAAKDRVNHALITDAKAGKEAYLQMQGMIDGDVRIEIEQNIKAAEKAEEVDKRLREQEHRQALADADDAAFGEYATAILTGHGDAKSIALDTRLSGRSKFALANAMEQKADREATLKTDPTVFNELFRRIQLPDGDPNKITDWHDIIPFQGKGVKFEDWVQLRQEIEGQGTAEGQTKNKLLTTVLDTARQLTRKNDMYGVADPKGDNLVMQATNEIMKAWDAGVKAGKSPYAMSNPESPDYVGAVIDRLKRSPAQVMQDIISGGDISTNTFAPDAATPGAEIKVEKDAGGVYLPKTAAEKNSLPAGSKYKQPGSNTVQIKQ